MSRVLGLACLACLFVVGCGDNGAAPLDAAPGPPPPDAGPPPDAPPDAPPVVTGPPPDTFVPANHGFSGTPCFDGLRYSTPNLSLPYVLACTEDQGVFKTALDADTTWTNTTAPAGINPHGRAIAINPNGPPVYYVSDGTTANNGFRSNTRGDTWTPQAIVDTDGTTPRDLYAFAFRQNIGNLAGSWSATDGALVLHGNAPGLVPHFVGATAGSVTGTVRAIASGGASDVYVAVYGQTPKGDPASGGIYWACDLTMTGGGTYTERDHGLADDDRARVWSLTVDPSTISNATFQCGDSTHGGMATTYYAALRGGGQIYKTIDGGATWTKASTGLAAGAEVYAIAIDCFAPPVAPAVVPTATCQDPSRLYAATSHGLYRSLDAGAHWTLDGFEGKQVRAVTVDPMPATATPHLFVGVNDPAGTTTGLFQTTDAVAALAAMPAACSVDQWCWRDPTPAGNDIAHIYATGIDNIWLIGAAGTLMQWDGAAWHRHAPAQQAGLGASQYAFSITGNASNDMWLIMGAAIHHWDGKAWTIEDTLVANGIQNFDTIWEAPNGDVWVTMNNGQVDRRLHGAGKFERIDTGCNCFLGNIWGLAANDFWITALPATIYHSDGKTFQPAYHPTSVVGSLTGVATDDVWVSGQDGLMAHWDGKAWTPMPTGLPEGGFIGRLAARATDDVWWWAEGGSSASSSFIHWDGKQLAVTPVDTTDVGVFLFDGAFLDGRWWLVGGAGAVYTKASDTTVKPIIAPNLMATQDIWGPSDNDLYFATAGEIRHWDGQSMQIIEPMTGAYSVSGVHSDAGNELFAIGFELTDDRLSYIADAFHFDVQGKAWAKTQLDQTLISAHRLFTKVAALTTGEAIAVGEGGMAYRYAGGAWTPIATGTANDLVAVYAPDADHAWITGKHGTLLTWSRDQPDVATPDPTLSTPDDLGAISGAGGVTWITAGASDVLRSTATGWERIHAGVSGGGLFATGPDQVVVSAAGQSALARWNGTAFVREDSGTQLATPVLYAPPGGHMLAAGLNTLVVHP